MKNFINTLGFILLSIIVVVIATASVAGIVYAIDQNSKATATKDTAHNYDTAMRQIIKQAAHKR